VVEGKCAPTLCDPVEPQLSLSCIQQRDRVRTSTLALEAARTFHSDVPVVLQWVHLACRLHCDAFTLSVLPQQPADIWRCSPQYEWLARFDRKSLAQEEGAWWNVQYTTCRLAAVQDLYMHPQRSSGRMV
jgi:hypothetical protein